MRSVFWKSAQWRKTSSAVRYVRPAGGRDSATRVHVSPRLPLSPPKTIAFKARPPTDTALPMLEIPAGTKFSFLAAAPTGSQMGTPPVGRLDVGERLGKTAL
eukprot:scaffold1881_cov256-Pinguiococcus_pyrenoidosus.AAC.24